LRLLSLGFKRILIRILCELAVPPDITAVDEMLLSQSTRRYEAFCLALGAAERVLEDYNPVP
jgi:hypothetical protein